jgi:hypothetical protein
MNTYEAQLISVINTAISSKKMIRYWYEDKTSNFKDWRIVEPHLVGLTKNKNPEIWLTGWFIPTPLQSFNNHNEGWGNFILNNIKKIEILDEVFQKTRPGYNRFDKRMARIYCSI